MTWPTAATKANLDASTDDPSQARAELASLVDKVNALITDALPSASYTASDVMLKVNSEGAVDTADALTTEGSGSFTPFVSFGGTSGTTGITYGIQTGRYQKIGKLMFFEIQIQTTNKGSSTGTFGIYSPVDVAFAASTSNNAVISVSGSIWGGTSFSTQATAFNLLKPSDNPAASRLTLYGYKLNPTSPAIMMDTDCSNYMEITISGFYELV